MSLENAPILNFLLSNDQPCPFSMEGGRSSIAKVPGIGPKMAEQIHEYFHPKANDDDSVDPSSVRPDPPNPPKKGEPEFNS